MLKSEELKSPGTTASESGPAHCAEYGDNNEMTIDSREGEYFRVDIRLKIRGEETLYSVILVEDKGHHPKRIKNSVPWEEFNCSVVGEAQETGKGGVLIAERNGHHHNKYQHAGGGTDSR